MSRIDDLVDALCPNGVPFSSVGEIATYTRGVTYAKNDERSDGGVRVLRSNNITLSSHTVNFNDVRIVAKTVRVRADQWLKPEDILISAASGSKAHVGKVAFINADAVEYSFGGFMAVLRTQGAVESRFLFHLLVGRNFAEYLESALASTTINNLGSTIMNAFRIPVPPVEVQREIVAILDTFMELEAELQAELEARRRQYQHYLYLLTSPVSLDKKPKQGWSVDEIGNVGRVVKGKTPIQKAIPGDYPLVATTLERQSSSDFQIDAEAVCVPLISSKGHGVASIARIYYQSGKFALGSILCAIVPNDPTELSAEYLFYYLQARKDFLLAPLMRGGANVSLPINALKSVPIDFPSLGEQRRIAKVLRDFDRLTSDGLSGLPAELAARRKQYEYYRDRLLTFEEVSA